jgi:hypothetical protein
MNDTIKMTEDQHKNLLASIVLLRKELSEALADHDAAESALRNFNLEIVRLRCEISNIMYALRNAGEDS